MIERLFQGDAYLEQCTARVLEASVDGIVRTVADPAIVELLTPALRSVRTEVAAELSGTVEVSCPTDTTLSDGGAVCLFEGSGVEPYGTTRVVGDGDGLVPQGFGESLQLDLG